MRKMAVLPSMLTLGNLLCGLHAVRFAAEGQYSEGSFLAAAWFVLLAMVFDALDGKVARWTHAASRFGSELDSLADMVSFGVAPAFLVAMMARSAESQYQLLVWLSCMVYVACAALRLARFNVETTLEESSHRFFRGLPSPAAAGQVVAVVILHYYLKAHHDVVFVSRTVPTVTFFAGILMVSRVRYPHLVSRWLSGRHPVTELAFLGVVALLLATHKEIALAGGFSFFTMAGVLGVAHKLVFHRGKADGLEAVEPDEETEEEEEPVY